MIDNTKEYILCAAIRRKEPRKSKSPNSPYNAGTNSILDIELGYRHHDIFSRFPGEISTKMSDQGFYTSKGRFVDRYEAMEIAYDAGQVSEETALSKSWYSVPLNDGSGNTDEEMVEYWKKRDKHKFNGLMSEQLY